VLNPYGAPPAPGNAITKPEIKAVDTTGKERMDDAIICLARTIYWEARGTDKTAMHAIANVVMNRLGHKDFPNTICGIVKEGREQKACQFSWWCDGLADSAQEKEPYEDAKEIARKALNRQLTDLTGGALYFRSRGVIPVWSKKYVRTARIGRFEFYKPPGEKAK
jgi:spore germination cell wall hydrolase CwlJ-like protein